MEITTNYTLDTLISNTYLSRRIRNSLCTHGITTIRNLLSMEYHRIKRLRNIGKKSVEEIVLFIKRLDYLKTQFYAIKSPADWIDQLDESKTYKERIRPYAGHPRSVPMSTVFDLMSSYATYVNNKPSKLSS